MNKLIYIYTLNLATQQDEFGDLISGNYIYRYYCKRSLTADELKLLADGLDEFSSAYDTYDTNEIYDAGKIYLSQIDALTDIEIYESGEINSPSGWS